MELTLDQALQKGIEAHKAGQVQEADKYYTAILKAQPKHPDANHNMGVLAVGLGKVQQALPFFKTALEANPSKAQYWLSYIDTLIKLDKMPDAKAIFEKAKSNGAKGDAFDQLEKRLEDVRNNTTETTLNTQLKDPPQDKVQSLIDLYNQGQFEKALECVSKLLEEFPESAVLFNMNGAVKHAFGKFEPRYKKLQTGNSS